MIDWFLELIRSKDVFVVCKGEKSFIEKKKKGNFGWEKRMEGGELVRWKKGWLMWFEFFCLFDWMERMEGCFCYWIGDVCLVIFKKLLYCVFVLCF